MIHDLPNYELNVPRNRILRWFRWEKKFFKIFIFKGRYPTVKFWISFCNLSKMRGQKILKFRFLGPFWLLKNMITKFFENSNFSYFLGIKSEINQYDFYWNWRFTGRLKKMKYRNYYLIIIFGLMKMKNSG